MLYLSNAPLRPRKKNCCVALSDRPYSKIKIKKSRVGKAPNFAQIGCFLRKMMEYAPKFGPFGCFLKRLFQKKNYRPTNPTFSEIPLEGNTTIIFFFDLMVCTSETLQIGLGKNLVYPLPITLNLCKSF